MRQAWLWISYPFDANCLSQFRTVGVSSELELELNVTILRSLLSALSLVIATLATAQSPLTEVASVNELDFGFNYVGVGIESRCGADWFVVESGHWKCVRRQIDGNLGVIEFGRLPLSSIQVIRPPVSGDRRILFHVAPAASGGAMVSALDPVTLELSEIGPLPASGSPGDPVLLLDADGDGIQELLLRGYNGATDRIVTLPPTPGLPFAQVRDLPFQAEQAGQFDGDIHAELLVLGGDRLKLYDAVTLQQEPYQPQGGFYVPRPAVIADWDHDGVDEMAVTASTGSTALVDPNGSVTPILVSLPWPAIADAISLVDWQAPGSRDLALWNTGGVLIVNPRTGAHLAQFALPEGQSGHPRNALQIDWDNDGDADLAWVHQGIALWVLRNGGGLTVQQRAANEKRPMGYASPGGPTTLTTVETFGFYSVVDRRLRQRDPLTLEVLSDVSLPAGGRSADCTIADLHSSPGMEWFCGGTTVMTLYAADGRLLWSRSHPESSWRRWSSGAIADATCVGVACRRIILRDTPQSTPVPEHVLRLFDSESGNELWSSNRSTTAREAIALTDLDGDGVPEIVHAESATFGTSRLVVLDGVSREQRWVLNGVYFPMALNRTTDSAGRLAMLEVDGNLSYLDPINGQRLRSAAMLPPGEYCTYCRIQYLAQGDTAGLWLFTYLDGNYSPALLTMPRDLRGPIWQSGYRPRPDSLRTLAPNLVHLTEGSSLYALSADQDEVFNDEFEGW